MATENIQVTSKTWQDIETLGELSFTENQVYTITGRGDGACEIALADSKPEESFLGHIAQADVNFNFTYTDEKIWVRCGNPVTIVIS